jgi:predicted acylesterase/phospholipase RssA
VTSVVTISRLITRIATNVRFFYDPKEFEAFFPRYVLDRMEREWRHNAMSPATRQTVTIDNAPKELIPFPSATDLPIVVAARMSMSFPFLFSAIPLYRVAIRDLKAAQNAGPFPIASKTWFSDGGLSSNMPIHFFDGPIPRWPTFALNLRGFPISPKPAADNFATAVEANPNNDQQKVFSACDYDPELDAYPNDLDKPLNGRTALMHSSDSLSRSWMQCATGMITR